MENHTLLDPQKKIGFMRLPQSQNDNVNSMCIVENPVCMNREQGGVNLSWDQYVSALTVYFLIT